MRPEEVQNDRRAEIRPAMKRIIAMIGTVIIVGLGFLMPSIAAVFQDRNLAGKVWQMENAAASITLVDELVELTDLDLFQSLELFSAPGTMVELTEGRCITAEEAAQKANLVAAYMMSAVYYDTAEKNLAEATPYLRTDIYGRSGIFWRCSWQDRPEDVVWIDDWNFNLMGFCLHHSDISSELPVLYSNLDVLCNVFYTFAETSVYMLGEDGVCVIIMNINTEEQYYLPINNTEDYLFFNLQFDPFSENGA